jgi:hypothetical protein
MDFLERFLQAAEWGKLAAIAALLVFFFNIAKFIIIQVYQKFRLTKALQARHKISLLIDNEESDNIILKYHTYYKRTYGFSFAFGQWLAYKEIPISGNSGAFMVDKNDILRNCKSVSSPYNFTLEIPNNKSAKEKYFSRLAFQGFIITGRGKVLDSDNQRWLIYFLHPDEPFHTKSGYSWELKNTLLD